MPTPSKVPLRTLRYIFNGCSIFNGRNLFLATVLLWGKRYPTISEKIYIFVSSYSTTAQDRKSIQSTLDLKRKKIYIFSFLNMVLLWCMGLCKNLSTLFIGTPPPQIFFFHNYITMVHGT